MLQLQRKSEENEQYQRRLCLQINQIEVPQAAEYVEELKVSVPDNVIDHACE